MIDCKDINQEIEEKIILQRDTHPRELVRKS
jgi:hypothetical protein